MDIREMLEKCKPFAPVVSAAVVAACVAGSLYGYKVPVYETKASVEDTQEQEDEVPVVKTSTEEETKEDECKISFEYNNTNIKKWDGTEIEGFIEKLKKIIFFYPLTMFGQISQKAYHLKSIPEI